MKEDQPYLESSYWLPSRKELLDWFQLNAPSLGEIYRGAVQFLNEEPPIVGRSHFICHAVREIRNNLPNFISGHRVTILQYKNRIDAIAADALLPGGPYDLWKKGETSRRVKDLTGSFAQLPHLPKMLKAKAVLDTLVEGCVQGYFVLRLQRPDKSVRTWWMSRPDDIALDDPALELWLSEAAELHELQHDLLAPHRLPSMWTANEIRFKDVMRYFSGTGTVQVQKNGYTESIHVPKAKSEVVERALFQAIEKGLVWLLSGPASILGEPVPPGILNEDSSLCPPPAPISVTEILPENIPSGWKDNECTALAVSTALSVKAGKTLPWKIIQGLLTSALRARFIEMVDGSAPWPSDFAQAQHVRFRLAKTGIAPHVSEALPTQVLVAEGELDSHEVQNLGDVVGKLFELKAKRSTPIKIKVRIEVGDGKTLPPATVVEEFNKVLQNVKEGLGLK